jgi:hypothetical protein
VIEMKKNKKARKGNEDSGNKRKAASAESTDRDDGPDCDDEANDGEDAAQGGNEFGQGAHKRKKKVTISALSVARSPPTMATQRHVMSTSSRRFIMKNSGQGAQAEGNNRMELDTHADTCVAGTNTVVLDLTGKTVSVSPFCDKEYSSMEDIPIATVTTAYDCPTTGRVFVLVINEAL